MTAPTAFWDSSAIVPLCVTQTGGAAAEKLFKLHPMAVWWITRVEIISAIQRLVRTGELQPARAAAGERQLALLQNAWREVQPGVRVREIAASLLARHPLCAADSLQLAAALIWCRENPHSRLLFTNDKQMQTAAGLLGFDARQI